MQEGLTVKSLQSEKARWASRSREQEENIRGLKQKLLEQKQKMGNVFALLMHIEDKEILEQVCSLLVD